MSASVGDVVDVETETQSSVFLYSCENENCNRIFPSIRMRDVHARRCVVTSPRGAGVVDSLHEAAPGESVLAQQIQVRKNDAMYDERYKCPTIGCERSFITKAGRTIHLKKCDPRSANPAIRAPEDC